MCGCHTPRDGKRDGAQAEHGELGGPQGRRKSPCIRGYGGDCGISGSVVGGLSQHSVGLLSQVRRAIADGGRGQDGQRQGQDGDDLPACPPGVLLHHDSVKPGDQDPDSPSGCQDRGHGAGSVFREPTGGQGLAGDDGAQANPGPHEKAEIDEALPQCAGIAEKPATECRDQVADNHHPPRAPAGYRETGDRSDAVEHECEQSKHGPGLATCESQVVDDLGREKRPAVVAGGGSKAVEDPRETEQPPSVEESQRGSRGFGSCGRQNGNLKATHRLATGQCLVSRDYGGVGLLVAEMGNGQRGNAAQRREPVATLHVGRFLSSSR